MPLLVQLCLVVVTLAVVAIAIALVRVLMRVERVTDQFSLLTGELHQWTVGAHAMTRDLHETLELMRGVVTPLHRIAERFAALGDRTVHLSEVVLGEVESPIRKVLAAS